MIKKIFVTLFLIISVVFSSDLVFAGKKIAADYYSDLMEGFLDQEITIYYDKETKEPVFIVSDNWVEYRITLPEEITSNILNKYFEWEKIAVANKVKVEKEINRISVNIYWMYGDNWYKSLPIKMIFFIFSQNENRHQLVIKFTKAVSVENEFITHKPNSLYLEKSAVEVLQKQLTTDFIAETVTKYLETKKLEDELFK